MKTIRELEYDGLLDQIEHLSAYTAWLQDEAAMAHDVATWSWLREEADRWCMYRETLKTALLALARQPQPVSERPALRTREVTLAGHVLTEWLFAEPRPVKILNACWSAVVVDPVGRQKINALRALSSAPVVLIWE